MKSLPSAGRKILLVTVLGWLASWAGPWCALAAAGGAGTNEIRIVELQGKVEIIRAGSTIGVQTTETNQVLHSSDRLRVGPKSRVALRWSDQSVVTFGALTEVEILPPHAAGAQSGLSLLKGLLSFFHRDEPGRIRVITRSATAGVEGTEFVAQVETADGREQTTFSVIDGQVNFGNAQGMLVLTNGQQATAALGQSPVRTAGFIANNVLQWCFYYPAVLDLRDLPLTREEEQALGESLAAYRAGDLLAALDKYPAGRPPGSEAGRIYHAALLLAVGEVGQTEAELAALSPDQNTSRLASALRTLVAAVKSDSKPPAQTPELATEFLAASYYEQSRAVGTDSLKAALAFARQAATNSPEFGFAWERVAELEFSFGRTDRALDALNKSLALAPRNAQALALNGFLLAAQNKIGAALERFDQAIAVDSALANAWLGRGLCRIRHGDVRGGREDLLVAAALEPQRASLRSYLAKAYADAGDRPRARHELELAKRLDPADPTAWLYSALLNEQANRLNESIRDLEKSQALNENRRVYRSQLLLDQDRAVRGANLARLYQEAGLTDVAVREAGQAVAADYTSYSAHLFLANAYEQDRAAAPFGQRFETPAFSEYLLTTLLGPAAGRLLAQPVTQQEYTRLLDRDGVGLSSSTEYLSRGAWNQYGAQYGTFGNSSYALEADYHYDPGQSPSSQLETSSLSARVKQMLTPQDGLLIQVYDSRWKGGDVAQHYDPATTLPGLKFEEKQSPNVLLGYNREWSPNSHTLLLASRIDDRFEITHPAGAVLLLATFGGDPDYAAPTDLTREFTRHYTANSIELQQIQQFGAHTVLLGTRFQSNTERIENNDAALPGNLSDGVYLPYFSAVPFYFPTEYVRIENERISGYLYDSWQINHQWQLFGGFSADYLRLARNTIAPPLSSGHEDVNQISPKAGVLWQPLDEAVVRVGYFRTLTGQDLDQSLRLEPTQFAGLPFTFRTAFPDSLVGGLSGERIDVWLADGRFKLGRGTYATLGFQELRSKVDRQIGAYTADLLGGDPMPTQAGESLRFEEQSLHVSLRQLLGDMFSVGVRYEVAKAQLRQDLTGIDPAFCDDGDCSARREGVLQTLALDAIVNHPSGFFAGANATWRSQTALTDTELSGRLPDEAFWQINLYIGYRSKHRRFECLGGLLNLADQDYRLHPVNLFTDPPRERTFAVLTRFNF